MVLPVLPMCRRLLAREMRGLRNGIGRAARQLHISIGKSNGLTTAHLHRTEAIRRSLIQATSLREPQHLERKLQQEIPSWPIPYWGQLGDVSLTKCISECRGQGFDLYCATTVLVDEMQKRNMQLVDEYAGRHLPKQLKQHRRLVWRAKPSSPQLTLPKSLTIAAGHMQNAVEMQISNLDCDGLGGFRSDADSLPPPPPDDDLDETATVYLQSCSDDADSWIISQPASSQYDSASIADMQEQRLPKRKRESGRIRQRRKLRLQATPGTDDDLF